MPKKANRSLLVEFHDLYCGLLVMYMKLSTLFIFPLSELLRGCFCFFFFFSSPAVLLIRALFSNYKVFFSN